MEKLWLFNSADLLRQCANPSEEVLKAGQEIRKKLLEIRNSIPNGHTLSRVEIIAYLDHQANQINSYKKIEVRK